MEGKGWAKLYRDEFDVICANTTTAQALVYFAIANCRSSPSDTTPPIGIRLIMKKTRLQRSTVYKAVSVLIDQGFIAKEAKGNRAVYRFPLLEKSTYMDSNSLST